MAIPTKDSSIKPNGASTMYSSEPQDLAHNLEKLTVQTGEKVGQFASDVAQRSSDYAKASRDYVKENPTKGVAFAALAGVFVGFILSMILRPRR